MKQPELPALFAKLAKYDIKEIIKLTEFLPDELVDYFHSQSQEIFSDLNFYITDDSDFVQEFEDFIEHEFSLSTKYHLWIIHVIHLDLSFYSRGYSLIVAIADMLEQLAEYSEYSEYSTNG